MHQVLYKTIIIIIIVSNFFASLSLGVSLTDARTHALTHTHAHTHTHAAWEWPSAGDEALLCAVLLCFVARLFSKYCALQYVQ